MQCNSKRLSFVKVMRFFRVAYVQGEMAERLNAAALKAVVPATVPWVRIPLSPPFIHLILYADPQRT